MMMSSPMSPAQPKPLLAIQTTTSPTSESDHQENHHGGGGGGGGNNININGNINNILQLSPPLGLEIRPPLQKKSVKYMECLKNHAAAIGGTATDGCGEFMAGGEEGSLEALKCSACNCHRNFHRKIQLPYSADHHHHQLMFMKKRSTSGSGVYINGAGEAAEIGLALGGGHNHRSSSSGELGKKRYRTKFSQEQKEKMQVFAERAAWKITKLDESEVRSFCQEIGIKRKVLKVWMHNNKYHLTKKTNTTTTPTPTTTSVE
ncbi:hypothetical protein ACP275_08G261000 [Erythranthe tilingii]